MVLGENADTSDVTGASPHAARVAHVVVPMGIISLFHQFPFHLGIFLRMYREYSLTLQKLGCASDI